MYQLNNIFFLKTSDKGGPSIHTNNFFNYLQSDGKEVKFINDLRCWWRIITKNNFVVYGYSFERSLICFVFAYLFHKDIKVVYMCHGFFFKELELGYNKSKKIFSNKLGIHIFKKLFKVFIKAKNNRVYSLSYCVKDHLDEELSLKNDSIKVFYPSINQNKFTQRVRKEILNKRLLFLGGVNISKGFNTILELGKHGYQIDVYGSDGPPEGDYKNIFFMGNVANENIGAVYDKYDILLYPSKLDNLPTVILESLCSGLVVLTTNIGELRYIISNNENGIEISNNNIEEVKKIIDGLISDPKQVEKISTNSIKYFNENFGEKNFSEFYEDIVLFSET